MSHTIVPPARMRASVGTPTGPELRRVPDPQPSSDHVPVQVEAFSINRGELRLFARRPEGWRPGQDIAGRVLAPDGSGPAAVTRVAAMIDFGGWAKRGHLVLLGSSSVDPAPITTSSLAPNARQTVHPFSVHGSGEPVGEDLADLARLTARELLDPLVGWVGSWDYLDEPMQALRDRRVVGKAVLRVDHTDEPR
ncbi:MAG: alcohol dehydrogenase zinc-binding protein [Solirubrobacterales bacterium]|nr:alcohol dehydrogenase zinc-binding protein [Solirubrobacterales bacterium]